MAKRAPLGRLIIAWGAASRDDLDMSGSLFESVRANEMAGLYIFHGFHTRALNSEPDPFASRIFGGVLKALLTGTDTVITDEAFDDARRRLAVQRAFSRALPGLVVEQVLFGAAPDSPWDSIVFDDDVYGDDGMSASNESIVVEADAPQDMVVAALEEAAARMMMVGDDGNEYVVPNSFADVYTPNYVSDVTVDEAGKPGFYIDCKGAIEPRMAATFREILKDELQRRGIFAAHVGVPEWSRGINAR